MKILLRILFLSLMIVPFFQIEVKAEVFTFPLKFPAEAADINNMNNILHSDTC